jgi:hypothetical protein
MSAAATSSHDNTIARRQAGLIATVGLACGAGKAGGVCTT